jgi:hypothetical protein
MEEAGQIHHQQLNIAVESHQIFWFADMPSLIILSMENWHQAVFADGFALTADEAIGVSTLHCFHGNSRLGAATYERDISSEHTLAGKRMMFSFDQKPNFSTHKVSPAEDPLDSPALLVTLK